MIYTSRLLALAAPVFAVWLGLAPASARAAELVLFDRAGCVWCERWKSEVGVIYHKTAEGRAAPLRVVHVDRLRQPEPFLKSPVIYTPTFIVVEDGRELGRIIGYTNDGMFWGQLGKILALKNSSTAVPHPKSSI